MTDHPPTPAVASPTSTGDPHPAAAGLSAWAQIDLGAITDNVAELARRAGPADVMAVVKADAYGHGLVPSARAAIRGGATWLGVAQLAEALELRSALAVEAAPERDRAARILTWLYVPGVDFGPALDAGLDLGVDALWGLGAIVAAARARGVTARVHLQLDSDLGRAGAIGDGWHDLLAATAPLQAEGAVEVVGIWSHFALADAPRHPTVRAQHERFVEAVAEAERMGIRPHVRHLANSAATLTNPSAHFDLVRPGLAVYGLSPVPDLGGPVDFGLREAMRVEGRLALVKAVGAGQGVSYGHTYTTSEDTLLGLVPIGYADGIPRDAGNVGPVSVDGRWLRVAGRVCMDQFVVNLGPRYAGSAGDRVVLLGSAADGEPTAQEWADATGTINYEIVTRMSSRLPRLYIGAEGLA